jgi:hypothetical protein
LVYGLELVFVDSKYMWRQRRRMARQKEAKATAALRQQRRRLRENLEGG